MYQCLLQYHSNGRVAVGVVDIEGPGEISILGGGLGRF